MLRNTKFKMFLLKKVKTYTITIVKSKVIFNDIDLQYSILYNY